MAVTFRELLVWKRSVAASALCAQVAQQFPPDERFVLNTQMRRAALSVALNIAEGNSRLSTKEYIQFLGIAHGSASEVIACIHVALELGYISDADELLSEYDQISRIIMAIIKKLQFRLSSL